MVRGRCASIFELCFERPPNGGDPVAMAELPHFCGPQNMGIGWTETSGETSGEREDWKWVQGEKEFGETKKAEVWIGEDLVWRGADVTKTVRIGDMCIAFEDLMCGEEEEESDDQKVSLVLKNEIWQGKRNPKMVSVVQENKDEPGAGSYARLQLEDFTKVPYKYPSGLVWCGTSISDQSLNEAECNRQTRFTIKKVKAFTLSANGAKYKPDVKVEVVLEGAFKHEVFLVIEVGINEITDEDGQSEQMRQQRVEQKMADLVEFACRMKLEKSLQKVVLLNRIPRCDSEEKAALSRFSNQAMRQAFLAKPDRSGVILRSLVLEGDEKLHLSGYFILRLQFKYKGNTWSNTTAADLIPPSRLCCDLDWNL